jgi:DNA-binding response OmpR family regulator
LIKRGFSLIIFKEQESLPLREALQQVTEPLATYSLVSANILVVEDSFVSGFLRSVLQRRGYDVIALGTRQACELLRAGTNRVDLLITNLPAAFTEFGNQVPLLYLAAYPDPVATLPFRLTRALRKPFHHDQLLGCIEALLRSA